MANKKLLIVDDEADIREILEFNLRNEGYEVDTAASAEEALKILTPTHRLILLDVMMDGMSGFHMAEKLRNEGNAVPVIFLTARDTENDMLTGFSAGGDDYITKPFSIKEVLARVRSVLKRTVSETVMDVLVVDGLRIDPDEKQAYVNKKAIELTKKEFEILCLLVKNSPHVYTREEILGRVWNDEGNVLERTIDVHVTRLRKKLGEYGNYIINRSGYGYCFRIN